MATPVAEVVKVNWKQLFPWLALFRTFGLALHVRQVFVGIVAAGLVSLGNWIVLGEFYQRSLGSKFVDSSWAHWVWLPMVDLTRPLVTAIQKMQVGGMLRTPDWWDVTQIVLILIWVGTISGLAGGILVRRAAFEFCREESLGLKSATRFVLNRSLDYLSAPGLPLLVVFGMGLFLALVGWLGIVIPGGLSLVSATWVIWCLVGLLMALLLVAVLLSWPMMIAAVSINGGDGFDALSRGFGFVVDRSRYYLWCVVITTVYGMAIYVIIWAICFVGAFLLIAGIRLGMGPHAPDSLPETWLPGMFSEALWLLLRGFAYSFFWSNVTVIYLVLRKSVDNANMDDIYVEGGSPTRDELPPLLNPQADAGPTLLPIIDPPARD